MPRFLLLLLASFWCAPALASSVQSDVFPISDKEISKEASEYLIPCADQSPKSDCRFQQDDFVREYINAHAGDWLAQSNVSTMLRSGSGGIVIKDSLQSCAWRIVASRSGSPYSRDMDLDTMRDICTSVGGSHSQAAEARARRIEAIIRSRKIKPVAVPEIDFDPTRDKDEQTAGE